MSTHRATDTTVLDGSKLQRETSLVQLLLAVAAAANNATTIEEGMQVCLDEVCAHTGWPIGHLYLVSSSVEGRLVSTSTWHLERPELFKVFRRGTEALDLERGAGLAGRVLASGKPVWITDVSKDTYFVRREEALETDIRSAFAFPVLIESEVVAVLEFFSQNEVEPDESFLEVMANVGAQLGRVVERKRSEEALSKLAAIVESSNDAIVGKSLDGTILSWNSSAQRLYGYSVEEVVGKSIGILVPPDHSDEIPQILERIRRGERVEHFETVRRRKDGGLIDVSLTVSPVKDASGNVVAVSATARDITERKIAEEAVAFERYLLNSLMDSTPDSIYFKDKDSKFTRINRALAAALNLTDPQDAVGKSDADFFSEALAAQSYRDEQEILRTGTPVLEKEELEVWPDGRKTWVLTTKLPLWDSAGRPVGTMGVSRDITERKHAETELAAALASEQAANQELDRLNKLKAEFVSIVSHEFRTALTGIQGFSEMMRDEDFSMQEMKEFAADINKDSQRLNRMISELLDLDRMESGRMALNLESVDLNTLIDHVASLSRRKAEGHQISLQLSDKVRPVLGDRDKLTQVLFNLISNAIKYSPAGVITISSSADGGVAHVQVEDRGIGIPKDALERVFDRYSRIESEKSRHVQGTGLGLPIARQIVEMHGGRIWAESVPGSGSVFHFTIPFGLSGSPGAR